MQTGAEDGKLIVAFSGRIGSGKTTLARRLVSRHDACHLRSNQVLRSCAARDDLGEGIERVVLQRYSAALDRTTGGSWLAEGLEPEVARLPSGSLVIIDAIRLPEQLARLREVLEPTVRHVHLRAPGRTLELRYRLRETEFVELPTYAEVLADETEAAVPAMASWADLVIDTGELAPHEVEAAFLRWLESLPGRVSDQA